MGGLTRKIVLALAFTVMPMQGLAATLSILLCHGDAQLHALHDQDAHDHGAGHDGHASSQHDDGALQDAATLHFCCHLSVTVSAVVTVPSLSPDFPLRSFAPDALHDLHFPDQPQRPPLA